MTTFRSLLTYFAPAQVMLGFFRDVFPQFTSFVFLFVHNTSREVNGSEFILHFQRGLVLFLPLKKENQ